MQPCATINFPVKGFVSKLIAKKVTVSRAGIIGRITDVVYLSVQVRLYVEYFC